MEQNKLNYDKIIQRIDTIFSQGQNVKMKNKDQFSITLKDTRNILITNKAVFINLKNDPDMKKIFQELYLTLQDLESKLNKLSLITFCRDKAEKYLANVTQKLDQMNIVLLSFLVVTRNKPGESVIHIEQNNDQFEQINELNQKIKNLELLVNTPQITKKPPVKIENKLFEGLKCYQGTNTRINLKLAFENFTDSINETGSTEAKVLLGKMYEKGEYIDKSYSKAFELYREASDAGSSTASYNIAAFAENRLYDNVKEFGEYSETAMDYYEKAGNQGSSDAFARLGYIYENGLLDFDVNLTVAFEYYKKAVELDENPEALNCLGNFYYNGKIVKQNYTIAVEHYVKAAKYGNVDAMNNLGICYEYGRGTEKNLVKAMECYKKASEKNHPIAMTNQGILLIKFNLSSNDDKDFKEAMRLLQLSVLLDEKNKEAYYYLGFLYENGYDGLSEDHDTRVPSPYIAFLHYKQAAELGHTKSKLKVGVAIYNGIKGSFCPDESEGINLIKIAAQENDQEAILYLQKLVDRGRYIY